MLNATFERKPFQNLGEMVAIADDVIKLSSKCEYCKRSANISHRLAQDGETVQIGGKENYIPLCLQCYQKQISS